jgi:hypothetical protein
MIFSFMGFIINLSFQHPGLILFPFMHVNNVSDVVDVFRSTHLQVKSNSECWWSCRWKLHVGHLEFRELKQPLLASNSNKEKGSNKPTQRYLYSTLHPDLSTTPHPFSRLDFFPLSSYLYHQHYLES